MSVADQLELGAMSAKNIWPSYRHVLALATWMWMFGALQISAQQLSISGTVHDPQTVAGGITVTLRDSNGGNRQVTTDETGTYVFTGLAEGSYELSFAGPGFETVRRTVDLGSASERLDIELSLNSVGTSVDVVDVSGKATASRMEIPNIDIPVQVSSISEKTIEQQGSNDLVGALRNASGVTAQRFYGLYEYYTIRGFFGASVLLVDGMRMVGNSVNTQLNNVAEVQVLKGPSSILYGSGALAGAINVIRKQPQAQPAYELFFSGGRFNHEWVGGGATGTLKIPTLLYRVDASYDHNDAWRGAGTRRANISPVITWLMNDRNRVSVHETINHDDFDGDGGLPVGVLNIPNFDLSRRFSTPYDFGHELDAQTEVSFSSNISPSWQFRDNFLHRYANDQYFVTEDPEFNPETYSIDRYALYFFHHLRPILNQADITGRFKFLGMTHNALAGYEFERAPDRYDTTADGGDHFPTSISLITFQDTQPPITSFPTASEGHFVNRTNAFFWQDQISLGEHWKVNVGGRFDDYHRTSRRDPWENGVPIGRGDTSIYDQSAYTYRAGLLYELPGSQQIYFSSSSSFTPVNIIPTTGPPLNPESGRSYEIGHRWQSTNGRFSTSLALYKIERNNVVIALGMGSYTQAGQQSSKGIDFDFKGDLGCGVRLLANYGYAFARFDDYMLNGLDLTGFRPQYTPANTGNVWLTKAWKSGFTASLGAQYRGGMFTDNTDLIGGTYLGGWTVFGGAVSYRHNKVEYSVNAENLFNRQRYFFGADYSDLVYPGTPINVFATVRYRF
jgi:iron complex outermembrane recepter protein